jgi:RNA polymerase sigma-70 factor (ECF subfamily)
MLDQRAMIRAMGGDRQAFAGIVNGCGPRLVRFAGRMVGDREAARDIVQNALVGLWLARSTYRPSGSPEAFLMRVVRNACIDHVRADRGRDDLRWEEDLDLPTPSCEAAVIGGALRDALGQALLKLPEAQRAVFVLSEFEGLSYQEIADIVGCPHGTVASRKYAAIESLRRMLARSLNAIIAQRLLPRTSGHGRVPANEIMLVNSRIRRMIDEGDTDFTLAIEAGRPEGMCTMDDCVLQLYREGTIDYEKAWINIMDRDRLGPPPAT